jgi:hypothetical protein
MTHSMVKIQIAPEAVPSTPSWLDEVAVFAHALRHLGVQQARVVGAAFARIICQSDQFNVGIYSEVLLFWSTVMTTFPRACPASRYRIASATSLNG